MKKPAFRTGTKFVTILTIVAMSATSFFPATAEAAVTIITNTGTTTFNVPADWNDGNNTIEVIGAGGGGRVGANGTGSIGGNGGGAGGAGGYSKSVNVDLPEGTTVTIRVGTAGAAGSVGGDTYVCNSTSNCATIGGSAVVSGAKGGSGATGISGATGGQSSSGVAIGTGNVKVNGGTGGAGGLSDQGGNGRGGGGGGGGAGAGGPGGAGVNGTAGDVGTSNPGLGGGGGAGGAGGGGAGGSASSGSGGNGTEWTSVGSGGGGGGGDGGSQNSNGSAAGSSGQYGAGGAGGGGGGRNATGGAATAGIQGVIVITYSAADTTAPTPDPMIFSSLPAPASASSISMSGSASDVDSPPVEYYFGYTACGGANDGTGGTDSGWQGSGSYTDTGLQTNKCYGFHIKARDSVGNSTATSTTASTTYTLANVPGTPTVATSTATTLIYTNAANSNPSSNPTTNFAVQVTATSPTDSTWLNRYVDGSGNPSASKVWIADSGLQTKTINGLTPNTNYTFKSMARNENGVETASSTGTSKLTLPTAPTSLTFTNITGTSTTVNWTAPTNGADTYKIERCETSGCTYATTTTGVSGTSYADTGTLSPNTSYTYRMVSTNASGDSAYSSTAATTTTPGAPTSVIFSGTTATSTTISWTAPSGGADTYKVERCVTASCSFTQIASAVGGTSYNDENTLTGNTSYTYRVRATNSSGDGPYSASAAELTYPGVPTTLLFSGNTGTSTTLSWTAPSGGATTYKIERCETDSCSFTQIDTTAATSYPDTGTLSPNTSYTYRVRGNNTAGDGLYSASAATTTTPGAPTSLAFSGVTGTSTSVSWSAPSGGADTYDLERCVTSSCSFSTVVSSHGSTSYDDTGTLSPNTSYTYRVRANAVGSGPYSTSAATTTTPGAPTSVIFSGTTGTSTTVSWTAPSGGATTYKVERCETASCSFTEIVAAHGSTSYNDTNTLSPNTSYTYRVRATNATGDGPYSSSAEEVTTPGAPTSLGTSGTDTTSTTLDWTAPSGGSAGTIAYKIERCSGSGCTGFGEIVSDESSTSYNDTGLTSGTVYRYRVRASTSEGGDSYYSNIADATTTPATPGTPSFSGVIATSTTVSWSASSGNVDVYKVERCETASCSYSQIGTPAGTSYDDTNTLTGNTSYTYRVRANANSLDGAYSSTAATTTPPDVPTSLGASGTDDTSTTLDWTAPSGGSALTITYKIERCEGGSCTDFGQIDTSATNSYNDTSLSAGTSYRYRVRASTSGGDGYYSNITDVSTSPDAPGTPTFSNVIATSTTVSWSAAGGASTYKLERCDGAGCSDYAEIVAGHGSTSYTDDTPALVGNTSYTYRVRATNATGDGPYSSGASTTTPPNVPTSPGTSSVTTTTLTVSWTAPTGGSAAAVTYKVERCEGSSCVDFSQITSGEASTSYGDSSLTPNTTYRYRVRANNGADGYYSTITSATTLPDAPGTPTFSNVIATSTTISWSAPSGGADTYKVERCETASCSYTEIVAGHGSTSYNDSNTLTGNTSYTYRVRSTSGGVDSAYSSTAATTTPPNVPTSPGTSSVTTTTLTVSWTAPTGGSAAAVTYKVERCAGSSCTDFSQITSDEASTSYGDSSLTPNTTYRYRVRANNGADGYYSTITSATTLPDAPGTPTFADTTAQTVTVNWTAPTGGADTYSLERCVTASCSYTEVYNDAATTFADSGLDPNTEYSYRVKATAGGEDSAYSGVGNVTTLQIVGGNQRFRYRLDGVRLLGNIRLQ